MKIRSLYAGQLLIEAVIAFGIVALVLVALLQLSNASVSNSGEANRQAVATNFATEGVQWIKGQRITGSGGWSEFALHCGSTDNCSKTNICLNQLSWSANCTTNPTIPGTEFNRRLSLLGETVGTKHQITATVTVSWWENGRQSSAKQWFVFVNR